MAANECWISVEVKKGVKCFNRHNYTVAVKWEESFSSLLGRVYSQNPAKTVEKAAIDLVVQ